MQSFASTKIEHYCRVDVLRNFTLEQQRQLAIPAKSLAIPPTSQSVEACSHYDLDYERLARLPFNEAMERRSLAEHTRRRSCSSWTFNRTSAIYRSSIQEDFQLVCDRAILLPTVQTIVMAGYGLGAALSGIVTDWLGRRPTTLLFAALVFLASMASGFSPTYEWYVTLRALHTLAVAAVSGSMYVLMMEVVGSSDGRAVCGNIFMAAFSLGYMTLPAVAYFVQQWRRLALAVALPQLLLLVMLWQIPESPRWLISKERYVDARRVIQQAAIANRRIPVDSELDLSSLRDDDRSSNPRGVFAQYLEMLSYRALLVRASLVGYLWIANAGLYFGTAMYSVEMGGNAYVNFFLGGLVEIPALISTIFLYKRYGRRWPMVFLLSVYGVAMFGVFTVKTCGVELAVLVVAFVTGAKFCVGATAALIHIYTVELFPTNVRAMALGVSIVVGRIGACSAPYVRNLGYVYWAPLPPLIFSAVAFLAAASTLFLPETHRRELPQTVDDALRLGGSHARTSSAQLPLLEIEK